MKRLALIGACAAALLAAACVPIKPPAPVPASKAVLGDSDAALPAQYLDHQVEGWAEGTCDLPTPAANKVLVHAGGHSTILYPFGYYDEATWQACMLRVIDAYGASNVWVATAPTPLAIYCAWGIDEYSARLDRANAWKLNVLPQLRPSVHIVDWRGLPLGSDCTHFTTAGAQAAAQIAQQEGF